MATKNRKRKINDISYQDDIIDPVIIHNNIMDKFTKDASEIILYQSDKLKKFLHEIRKKHKSIIRENPTADHNKMCEKYQKICHTIAILIVKRKRKQEKYGMIRSNMVRLYHLIKTVNDTKKEKELINRLHTFMNRSIQKSYLISSSSKHRFEL